MRKEENSHDVLYLTVMIIVGLALRFDFLRASDYVIDADEGIVGLMAKHILDGQGIPVFYYGQHYMGSLEAVLASLSFLLLGVSSFALKLVPLLFSLAFIVLCYQLAREVWDRTAGRIAALTAAVGPSALIVWSAKARGGFIEILVIGALAILFTIRWIRPGKPSTAQVIPIALLLGIGWWVNNQIIYFILTIAFAMFSRIAHLEDAYPIEKIRKLCAVAAIGAVSFFLGGMPYWIYNINHDFVSFDMFRSATHAEIGRHLAGLVTKSLPILLGSRQFWSEADTFRGATPVVAAVFGVLLAVLIAMRYREILRLFVLRLDFQRPVELFLILFVCSCTVFAASSFGWLVQAPRYLLPMYVAICPLVGIAVTILRSSVRYAPQMLLAAILGINLFSCYPGFRAIPGEPFVYKQDRVSRDHAELISWLEENNIAWVRTNYWIGYRLAFETKEQVRFAVFQEPQESRIKSYETEARSGSLDVIPFLLVPAQTDIVKKALDRLGYAYEEKRVSGYDVLYRLKRPYHDLKAINVGRHAFSSNHQEAAELGIDGTPETRWGSAKPQAPGMEYKVLFDEPRTLRAVEYSMGQWASDYPRGLTISLVRPDGSEAEVISDDSYKAIEYAEFGSARSDHVFPIPPTECIGVRFVQTESHPVFDWSIAELYFYE